MGNVCCSGESALPQSKPQLRPVSDFTYELIGLIWVLGCRLRKDVIREIASYTAKQLPLLLVQPSKFIWIYPPSSGQVVGQMDFNHLQSASFTLVSLGVGQVLLCLYEYSQPGNCLQLLDNGRCIALPRTLVQRDQPGMIFDPGTQAVYLFGGMNYDQGYPFAKVRKSERFDFSSFKWTAVPEMTHARASFTPCRYAGLFYLCGGLQATIETYEPTREKYSLLDISLPEISSCHAVFDNDTLIVLSDNFVTRWQQSRLLDQQHCCHPVGHCHQLTLANKCLYVQNLLTLELWEIDGCNTRIVPFI